MKEEFCMARKKLGKWTKHGNVWENERHSDWRCSTCMLNFGRYTFKWG